MVPEDKKTEEIIFEAAKEVFTEKGFDGARMEEISQRAGINKSLLHYYYRSKEKLFNAIFELVMGDVFREVSTTISSDLPFTKKVEFLVEMYINLIMRNPHIPIFIMSEMHRNPKGLISIFKSTPIVKNNGFKMFSDAIREEVRLGNIEPIEPEHLIINILGLCIFPVVAKPILQTVIFNEDKRAYEQFIESRKKEVARFIINSIKKQK